MSATTDRAAGAAAGSDVIVDLKGMWIGWYGLFIFYSIVGIYESIFGWRAGLDSFAPEFQTYWTWLLWEEIPLELASGAVVATYLWKTRDRNIDAVSPREEMRRLLVLVQWLVIYAWAFYCGASFTEQDAAWSAVTIRDTHFTPVHIIEFYLSYPIFSIIAIGAFFYAKTRIPYFAHGHSVALLIATIGPFMMIPSVHLYDWGNAVWLTEERFAAPQNWGLVFFGWMVLGVFGVVLIILMRIRALVGEEFLILFLDLSSSLATPVPATLEAGKLLKYTVNDGAYVDIGDVVAQIDTGTPHKSRVQELTAPFSGKIHLLGVGLGAFIRPGDVIAVIDQTTRIPVPMNNRTEENSWEAMMAVNPKDIDELYEKMAAKLLPHFKAHFDEVKSELAGLKTAMATKDDVMATRADIKALSDLIKDLRH